MRRLLFACLLLIGGCATTGTQVDQSQVKAFTPGITTRAEVEARLGPPTMTQTMPDGGMILTYSYAHAQVRAASFIPVVGLFAGGSDVKADSVSIWIDPQGHYQTSQHATSQYGAGLGMSSGAYRQ